MPPYDDGGDGEKEEEGTRQSDRGRAERIRQKGDEIRGNESPLEVGYVGESSEAGSLRKAEIGCFADELVARPPRPGDHGGGESEDEKGDFLDEPRLEQRVVFAVRQGEPAQRPEVHEQQRRRQSHEAGLGEHPEDGGPHRVSTGAAVHEE